MLSTILFSRCKLCVSLRCASFLCVAVYYFRHFHVHKFHLQKLCRILRFVFGHYPPPSPPKKRKSAGLVRMGGNLWGFMHSFARPLRRVYNHQKDINH